LDFPEFDEQVFNYHLSFLSHIFISPSISIVSFSYFLNLSLFKYKVSLAIGEECSHQIIKTRQYFEQLTINGGKSGLDYGFYFVFVIDDHLSFSSKIIIF